MQRALLLITFLTTALAKPEGYFHQQYQYSRNAESYRDNELERREGDEGFYSKHGDLGGQTAPKINSYSTHSQYENPKFKNGQQASGNLAAYGQTGGGYGTHAGYSTDYGNRGFGSNYGQQALGLSSYQDASNFGGASSSSHSSRYSGGFSSSSSSSTSGAQGGYTSPAVSSQLQALTRQLQDDMSRQLQSAIRKQYQTHAAFFSSSSSGSSGFNNYINEDIRELEDVIRNNLTRSFQEALNEQYRTHANTFPYPYTTTGDLKDEFEQLKQHVEQNLISEVRQGVMDQYTSAGSISSTNNRQYNYRPSVRYQAPASPSGGYRRTSSWSSSAEFQTGYQPQQQSPEPAQYVVQPVQPVQPAIVPQVPLSQVITSVEEAVRRKLQKALVAIDHQFEEQSSYVYNTGGRTTIDYTSQLNQLTDELVRNLTRTLENELRKTYGRYEERNSYIYSTASTRPLFTIQDLEEKKQQIRDDLVRQLQDSYRQKYNSFVQRSSYVAQQRQQSSQIQSETAGQSYRPAPRPQPLSTGSQSSSTNSFSALSYNRNSGYQYVPSEYPAELREVATEVQSDLSRQLQNVLSEQEKQLRHLTTYSSGQRVQQPNFHQTFQQLQDELRRNFTDKLDESLRRHYRVESQSGAYFFASGGGSGSSSQQQMQQQLERLRSALQSQLMTQLEQGLSQQQSYFASGSSSSSSSSASSGAKSARLTNYGSGLNYEECDDSQIYQRSKRSTFAHVLKHHWQKQDEDLQQTEDLLQKDIDDFTQQQENADSYEKLQQQTEDDTQQIEVDSLDKLRNKTVSPTQRVPSYPAYPDYIRSWSYQHQNSHSSQQDHRNRTSYTIYHGPKSYQPGSDSSRQDLVQQHDNFNNQDVGLHQQGYSGKLTDELGDTQQIEQTENLFQQQENPTSGLQFGNYQTNRKPQVHPLSTQQEQFEDLTQQKQSDLTQQQQQQSEAQEELEALTQQQQTDGLTQQVISNSSLNKRRPRPLSTERFRQYPQQQSTAASNPQISLGNQQTEDLTQQEQYEDLTQQQQQQAEDTLQQQESGLQFGNYQTNRKPTRVVGFQQQRDDTQQQEVEPDFVNLQIGRKPNTDQAASLVHPSQIPQVPYQPGQTEDFTQQQQSEGLIQQQQQIEDFTQQQQQSSGTGLGSRPWPTPIISLTKPRGNNTGFGRLQTGSQQSEQQTEDFNQQQQFKDLTQQQEQLEDLTQQEEEPARGFGNYQTNAGYERLQTGSQRVTNPQTHYNQQSEQISLTQQKQSEGLTQEQEQQQLKDLTQEQLTDLTQQQEEPARGLGNYQTNAGYERLQTGSQRITNPQTHYNQQSEQKDLTQQQQQSEGLTQEQEQTSFGNNQRDRLRVILVANPTQQRRNDNSFGTLQIGNKPPSASQIRYDKQEQQQSEDLTQQQEQLEELTQQQQTQQTSADFGKLEFGNQRVHNPQTNRGQSQQQEQTDDLTQQRQQSSLNSFDNYDSLTQQTEDSTSFGQLQTGSQHLGSNKQSDDSLQQQQSPVTNLGNYRPSVWQVSPIYRKPQTGRQVSLNQQQTEDLIQHEQREDLNQQQQAVHELGNYRQPQPLSVVGLPEENDQQREEFGDFSQQQTENLSQQQQKNEDNVQQQEQLEELTQGTGVALQFGNYKSTTTLKPFIQSTPRTSSINQNRGDINIFDDSEETTQNIGSQWPKPSYGSYFPRFHASTQKPFTSSNQPSQPPHNPLYIVGQGEQYERETEHLPSPKPTYSQVVQANQAQLEDVFDKVDEFESVTTEKQNAFVVQNVDNQASPVYRPVKGGVSPYRSQYQGPSSYQQPLTPSYVAQNYAVESPTISSQSQPTEEPGFWKNVGNKLENTYNKAKQAASSFAEKVRSSIG